MGKKKKQQKKHKKSQQKPIRQKQQWKLPQICWGFFLIPLSFFYIEWFAAQFLAEGDLRSWILKFGVLWAVILSCGLRLLPYKAARIGYGIVYFASAVYAGFQTGYYHLFAQMMWLSDFRYASEGADYADVLLTYPLGWWLGILGMIAAGALILWKFPRWKMHLAPNTLALILMVFAATTASDLPEETFDEDKNIKYARGDYGRAQSAEAAYTNMFNTYRLYQICGLYQTLAKDIYANAIFPHTPAYVQQQKEAREEIDAYFAARGDSDDNEMTGLLEGKNVILVLMESMDDWMFGNDTPTLNRLREEGIDFTNFYTPVYGGIRTFNTEFCINTGSYLSSQGGYAFDYVTNHFNQSLASLLTEAGYSAKTFHYNDASFYSRGEFSPAMGYSEYVCYADYVRETDEKVRKNLLYDDLLLFDNEDLNEKFFRKGQPTLNFVITRSAHLSYKYNEVLSYWGLKKYPGYRGLTGNEETDCAYLKAKLVDDLFERMLTELEEKGQLEDTVIIGITDHYTYGYKDMDSLLELSGVAEEILLEKTPCFIWSADLEAQTVDKVLNTADFLPTVMNLLGLESEYPYIGQDAFDVSYEGFVPFSDGGWICGDVAYDANSGEIISVSGKPQTISAQLQEELAQQVQTFIRINNLILEMDYYR